MNGESIGAPAPCASTSVKGAVEEPSIMNSSWSTSLYALLRIREVVDAGSKGMRPSRAPSNFRLSHEFALHTQAPELYFLWDIAFSVVVDHQCALPSAGCRGREDQHDLAVRLRARVSSQSMRRPGSLGLVAAGVSNEQHRKTNHDDRNPSWLY
jgi:hypothetical protein